MRILADKRTVTVQSGNSHHVVAYYLVVGRCWVDSDDRTAGPNNRRWDRMDGMGLEIHYMLGNISMAL